MPIIELRLLPPSPQRQSGQIGLVILLIMVVLMTIGLSVAQQSSQDLLDSQLEQDTTLVLNAAEAGIEDALSNNLTSGTFNLDSSAYGDIDVEYQVTEVTGIETRLYEMISGELDVTGVTDGHTLQIDWSLTANCGSTDRESRPASLVVTVFYDDAGSTRVRHIGVAACNTNDEFQTSATGNYDGYRFRNNINLRTGDFMVRIKPIYNDTHIRVRSTGPSWSLAAQQFNIRSEAVKQQTNETRIVEVQRTNPSIPSVFDFAVYSGTTIVK